MDSILTSIKELLGITEECEHFDRPVIAHINSVFSILNQLGVGPKDGFSIKDKTAKWSEYISNDSNINLVKSYMHLKVKLLFDPPTGSAMIESINRQINEFEWRINLVVDPPKSNEEENQNG